MRQIKDHVKELFRDIPASDNKELMMQDIIQNLEEKVGDLIFSGKEEEDAINKAIVEFGDIEDIKKELGTNRLPVKKPQTLFFTFRILTLGKWTYYGVVRVYQSLLFTRCNLVRVSRVRCRLVATLDVL